jgi:glutamate-1-semialdehyde 2,1-aminomutase
VQEADWSALQACDELLMPGREVNRLVFPFPFSPKCDFDGSNEFVLEQARADPASGALMLVHPSMSAEFVEQQVSQGGFLGFKPYRTYSVTGDPVECRITDFLPRHQIEVAHRRRLIVMMHLAKRNAVADPQNIEDLIELCGAYPGVQWILAHCARSYSAWPLERAAGALKDLPNVWYDTSSVCESDAFDALYSRVGIDRVMYGSDDIPVGILRGKYIALGYAWTFLSEHNHQFDLSHCDSRFTFTRYEQLRAMRRAAERLGLTQEENQRIFRGNAERLMAMVRGSE